MHLRHNFAQGDPYPKAAPRAARRDAWADNGTPPGSDLDFMRHHYFDACNIDYAILSPLYPTGQGDTNLEFAAAMCRAANDWQVAAWTSQDRRCKASILVPSEDAQLAVAEIERCAVNPDFVQVLFLTRAIEPLGRRRFWPIYEAAVAHGLPVGIHVFGYSGHPVTGAGWPSYYCEEMTGHAGACQTAVASLVLEGVFERLPELKVVKIEGGFGWLPALTWRLDKHWARLRAEVPHLKRPPSEYLAEQLFITTQPMEEPERSAHLLDLLEQVGFDRLLFATDYPHWDFDDPFQALPRRLGIERRKQIYSGNARRLYRLD
jgi:predicted TIM-barrel fold metal-dependent hydrolase